MIVLQSIREWIRCRDSQGTDSESENDSLVKSANDRFCTYYKKCLYYQSAIYNKLKNCYS